jgi:hypothetical protein
MFRIVQEPIVEGHPKKDSQRLSIARCQKRGSIITIKELINDLSLTLAGFIVVWEPSLSLRFKTIFVIVLAIHYFTEKKED